MAASNQPLSFNAPAYPLDKIYFKPVNNSFFVAQSAAAAAPDVYTTTVENTKDELFFTEMQVSVDNSSWYDSGFEPYYLADPISKFKRFSGWCNVDVSSVTLSFYALDSGYTMYYRLVGYSLE